MGPKQHYVLYASAKLSWVHLEVPWPTSVIERSKCSIRSTSEATILGKVSIDLKTNGIMGGGDVDAIPNRGRVIASQRLRVLPSRKARKF